MKPRSAERKRLLAAGRAKTYRRRKSHGRRMYRIEADEAHVETLLADAGYLPRWGSDDPAEIERALERAIADWRVASVTRDA